jgi:hypothetical protein
MFRIRDPLSNNYFIAAYEDGSMALIDAETHSLLHEFEAVAGSDVPMLAWVWLKFIKSPNL